MSMPTLEEAIGIFEQLSKLCETNGIHDSQELYKQYAEWLRELQARRKQPEIVHCGECKHSITYNGVKYVCCEMHNTYPNENYFCGDAERRTE